MEPDTRLDDFTDYETVEYYTVYAELIRAARYRGTVKYEELCLALGWSPKGDKTNERLTKLLEAISRNEHQHDRPMLSAIAVKSRGGMSEEFIHLARSLFV